MERSVNGTKKATRKWKKTTVNYAEKSALTPEKVSVLQKLFNERIAKFSVDSEDFAARLKSVYFKRLLSDAIGNISKKVKSINTLEADILL